MNSQRTAIVVVLAVLMIIIVVSTIQVANHIHNNNSQQSALKLEQQLLNNSNSSSYQSINNQDNIITGEQSQRQSRATAAAMLPSVNGALDDTSETVTGFKTIREHQQEQQQKQQQQLQEQQQHHESRRPPRQQSKQHSSIQRQQSIESRDKFTGISSSSRKHNINSNINSKNENTVTRRKPISATRVIKLKRNNFLIYNRCAQSYISIVATNNKKNTNSNNNNHSSKNGSGRIRAIHGMGHELQSTGAKMANKRRRVLALNQQASSAPPPPPLRRDARGANDGEQHGTSGATKRTRSTPAWPMMQSEQQHNTSLNNINNNEQSEVWHHIHPYVIEQESELYANDSKIGVRLKGSKSSLYMCFNKRGKLHTRVDGTSVNCLFQEEPTDHSYIRYRSVMNATWLVGFDGDTGEPIPGTMQLRKDGSIASIKRERCYQFAKQRQYPLEPAPARPSCLSRRVSANRAPLSLQSNKSEPDGQHQHHNNNHHQHNHHRNDDRLCNNNNNNNNENHNEHNSNSNSTSSVG